MPPYPFSSFQRAQVTMELRYADAFILWDRTGTIWREIEHQYKSLRNTGAAPNLATFIADERFGLSVGINQAVITDHKPSGGANSTTEAMGGFAKVVIGCLEIPVLKRVGTRIIHRMRCKSAEDARSKLEAALPIKASKTPFFNIQPERFSPHLKLDVNDGELGYTVQFHANERTFEFEPPPEVSDFELATARKTIGELVLDFDFYTMKPIPTESFDASVWVSGWHKSINKEADRVLDFFKDMQ